MAVLGFIAFASGVVAALVLAALKWRFWPPVYEWGIPVYRDWLAAGTRPPEQGAVYETSSGKAKMADETRLLFMGTRPAPRSNFAFTATIDFTGDRAEVVARVPAEVVLMSCLGQVPFVVLAAAVLAQDGNVLVAGIFLAMGMALEAISIVAFRVFDFDQRKRAVLAVARLIEAGEPGVVTATQQTDSRRG
jgi:hypothetical protein